MRKERHGCGLDSIGFCKDCEKDNINLLVTMDPSPTIVLIVKVVHKDINVSVVVKEILVNVSNVLSAHKKILDWEMMRTNVKLVRNVEV